MIPIAVRPSSVLPTRSVGAVQVVTHQLHYDLLEFARNRSARFFALAMPVGFLLLFCTIFGDATLGSGSHLMRESTYYVAGLTTFGIVDVGFMNLVISTVEARETGLLRRRQATPQPAWTVVVARFVVAMLASASLAILLLAIGRVAYRASVPLDSLIPLGIAILVGCIAFVSLGFAVTTLVRSAQAAQPAAMALSMPLFFISGVFVPAGVIPAWLLRVADVFPVRREALALLAPFTSQAGGGAWRPGDLLVVGLWGVAGMIVAVRRFRWSPQDL
jgi:ABC-2 type transport system permease protein